MNLTRNVKIWVSLFCLATSLAAPYQEPTLTFDLIDMAAISRMSPQQLEALAEGLAAAEIMRTKRSSAQAVAKAPGIQSKLGFLGQASAGVAGLFGSSSGKEESAGYSYGPPSAPEHDEGKVDFLGLKKSILYTLFQAVKAITGGVTILKGQLIKGGGALASTLGKVISGKGDAVSNLGKKIVNSAALSQKKPPPPPPSPAVYGPPHPHLEYPPPTAYGTPTGPGHYPGSSYTGPSGYAAHKFTSQLDGRSKLNGLHAGLVFLTPLGETGPEEPLSQPTAPASTPLEPPPISSIFGKAIKVVKGVLSSIAPTFGTAPDIQSTYQPPPPPQPIPPFKPMSWDAVNSYGEPTMVEGYSDFERRNPSPSYDYGIPKIPEIAAINSQPGLTPEKVQKITHNLKKLDAVINGQIQRSSEDFPRITGLEVYGEMLRKNQVPILPTEVIADNEIGVLSAELLPTETPTTTQTPITTTKRQETTTIAERERRKKDLKFILVGNRIIQV